MDFHREILESSPQWPAVQKIKNILIQNGYHAYLAGGAVRDGLLGLMPKDFDIATEASVDQIESLFDKVILVGKSFGVLRVVVDGNEIEIAQFRKESDYRDGRHPSLVSPGTPAEDAERRDLTINALFYDLKDGRIIDFVGGLDDIKNKCIRCVGNAETRFQEDHLRLLRALRFKNSFTFQFEPKTFEAIIRNKHLVADLSRERVQDELIKMLKSKESFQGLEDLFSNGFMPILFSERAMNYKDCRKEIEWILKQENLSSIEKMMGFLWRTKNYESILDGLRLSRADEKVLKDGAWVVNHLEEFLSQRPVEQWLRLKNELVVRVLEWISQLQQSFKSFDETILRRLDTLFLDYKSRGLDKSWPDPLLKGDDLKDFVQGEKLGYLLKMAFMYQIETMTSERTMVLSYIRNLAPEINIK